EIGPVAELGRENQRRREIIKAADQESDQEDSILRVEEASGAPPELPEADEVEHHEDGEHRCQPAEVHHAPPLQRARKAGQHLHQGQTKNDREQRECEVECVHAKGPFYGLRRDYSDRIRTSYWT